MKTGMIMFLGTDLIQIAAHEFGHSLGLSHSKDLDAIMTTFYSEYKREVHLAKDDIQGIQFQSFLFDLKTSEKSKLLIFSVAPPDAQGTMLF